MQLKVEECVSVGQLEVTVSVTFVQFEVTVYQLSQLVFILSVVQLEAVVSARFVQLKLEGCVSFVKLEVAVFVSFV